jgi:membrane protease YdiL (CAAX protease family)
MAVSAETKATSSKPGGLILAAVVALAGGLFVLLFRFQRLGPLDFWWWMGLNIALVASVGFAADEDYAARLKLDLKTGLARKTTLGLASAFLLYGLFAAGRLAALKIFPFAASGIASVYGLKTGAGAARVALLLGLLIGPGEEIVWRGFLQENLSRRLGGAWGFFLTALVYTLVHIASGNTMLVLAAAVCGVFWGSLYAAWRSPVLNAVSHTAWALVIFILRPL